MKTASVWESYQHKSGVLVIIDKGTDERSVTNDAENVLACLRERDFALFDAAPAVIYRDSMGDFDGLRYDPDKNAVEFYPLNSSDAERAVEAALSCKKGTLIVPSALAGRGDSAELSQQSGQDLGKI